MLSKPYPRSSVGNSSPGRAVDAEQIPHRVRVLGVVETLERPRPRVFLDHELVVVEIRRDADVGVRVGTIAPAISAGIVAVAVGAVPDCAGAAKRQCGRGEDQNEEAASASRRGVALVSFCHCRLPSPRRMAPCAERDVLVRGSVHAAHGREGYSLSSALDCSSSRRGRQVGKISPHPRHRCHTRPSRVGDEGSDLAPERTSAYGARVTRAAVRAARIGQRAEIPSGRSQGTDGRPTRETAAFPGAGPGRPSSRTPPPTTDVAAIRGSPGSHVTTESRPSCAPCPPGSRCTRRSLLDGSSGECGE